MGSLTNVLENKILDHILGNTAYTQEANLYLCMCVADPTDGATGASMNEVANANGYARTEITAFDVASNRATENTNDIIFPEATGSWGTVTHWAIVDNPTYGSGEVIAYGSFSTSKSIIAGNIPQAAAGDIDIVVTAGGMTTYLANKILDHIFLNTTYAQPTIYVGVSTSDPGDTGSQVGEPSGNNYAREAVPDWDVASGGASENTNVITFNTASGSWGTIAYVFLIDALTGGNMLMQNNVGSSQAITTNDIVEFVAGAIDITLD